jgi:hypothetical protein
MSGGQTEAKPRQSAVNLNHLRLAVAYFARTYEFEEEEAKAAKRGIRRGSFVPPSQWGKVKKNDAIMGKSISST